MHTYIPHQGPREQHKQHKSQYSLTVNSLPILSYLISEDILHTLTNVTTNSNLPTINPHYLLTYPLLSNKISLHIKNLYSLSTSKYIH